MKQEIPSHIVRILQTLPKLPGVYQMIDTSGGILYIGKAKNLKSRVQSYFDTSTSLTIAKKRMIKQVDNIEWILTQNEAEALVLETNLIKHFQPKYNILMKDDKNLAYIKITNSPVPQIIKTRKKIQDGGEYFGPYGSNVDLSVRVLKKIFKVRNCRMKFGYTQNQTQNKKIIITDSAAKTPPCMDYYIGICPAPCLLDTQKILSHTQGIEQIRAFLHGNYADTFAKMEHSMLQYAKNLEFEKAQELKIHISILRSLHQKQQVRDIPGKKMDIIVMYEKYEKVYIGITRVRLGQIISVHRHEVVNQFDESNEEIVTTFLMHQYTDTPYQSAKNILPEVLILQKAFMPKNPIYDFLSKYSIDIEVPLLGPKKQLINFTQNQLREYAYKTELVSLNSVNFTRQHMSHILDRLGFSVPKNGKIIFECYDISHTHGHFTVASRVVMYNGKMMPHHYRRYNIKTLVKDGEINDFASHKEVAYRRTIEGIDKENFVHLMIIDGGKGQLSSAISGMENAFLQRDKSRNISMCAIAKKEEEVFIAKNSTPIIFEKGSPELMLLQKLRDESHRFAITANKSSRTKSMKKNILEQIPGIGPKTRKKLLSIAGSIDNIKHIDSKLLITICTKKQLHALGDHGII